MKLKCSNPFSHSSFPSSGAFFSFLRIPSSPSGSSGFFGYFVLSEDISILWLRAKLTVFSQKIFVFNFWKVDQRMNPRATSLSHESRVVLSLRWIDERTKWKRATPHTHQIYDEKTNVIDEVKISFGWSFCTFVTIFLPTVQLNSGPPLFFADISATQPFWNNHSQIATYVAACRFSLRLLSIWRYVDSVEVFIKKFWVLMNWWKGFWKCLKMLHLTWGHFRRF